MAPTTQITAKYILIIALHLNYKIKLPTLCDNSTNITYIGQIHTDLKNPNTCEYFNVYLITTLRIAHVPWLAECGQKNEPSRLKKIDERDN